MSASLLFKLIILFITLVLIIKLFYFWIKNAETIEKGLFESSKEVMFSNLSSDERIIIDKYKTYSLIVFLLVGFLLLIW